MSALYIFVSIQTHINKIGSATNTPLKRNGTKEPSLNTLIANNGIQPTGDVFRIINAIEISAVKITVFKVNLFF